MARTQTQKALRKATRSGQWTSEQSRRVNGDYGAISQHVRLTPTKQEKLQKVKHKKQIIQDGGASFYFVFERSMPGKEAGGLNRRERTDDKRYGWTNG